MGDSSRMDRCDRFVKEFGEEVVSAIEARHGLGKKLGHPLWASVQLGWAGVEIGITIDGVNLVIADSQVFDANEDANETVYRLQTILGAGASRRSIVARLKKADLIPEGYMVHGDEDMMKAARFVARGHGDGGAMVHVCRYGDYQEVIGSNVLLKIYSDSGTSSAVISWDEWREALRAAMEEA